MTPELAQDILIATQMVLSSQPTKPVDALFVHGRSYGDWTGIFEKANDLVKQNMVGKVFLYANEGQRAGDKDMTPYMSNPGRTWCFEQLIQAGVPADRITSSYKQISGLHTRWESDDFVEASQAERWTTGAIICQPHQALRAYLGWIKVMEQQNWTMDLAVAVPTTTPWHEIVRGSQGANSKARILHIGDELKRIAPYQEKGDLATFDQFYAYFEARERGSLRLGHSA